MSRRFSSWLVERSVNLRSIVKPLAGTVVADFTRHLPGPFASRELLERGARVVRVETPDGDPLRGVAPAWDEALNSGKESIVWDRDRDPILGPAVCARADVVLEGFRPGVAERLGIGPRDVPDSVVYCSITGFGADDQRAGHDLNYVGWAGLLADTAPALPPVQIADLAGGALCAVVEILGALIARERSGRGTHITVSMTHNAHRLAAHRLHGEPERTLTGALACYRIYATRDKRFLTITPLEPKFWQRLCELLDRRDLVERQYEADQEAVAHELASIFERRTLAEWLELFDGEDVMVGPVATLAEAAARFGRRRARARPPALGEHTERWRTELASFEG
jgi:alpha-methylacyl-CoA racemase